MLTCFEQCRLLGNAAFAVCILASVLRFVLTVCSPPFRTVFLICGWFA